MKKIGIVLFGLFFLSSLLTEIYLFHVPGMDLFSILGIGAVVLITGVLWYDSIFDRIKKGSQNAKFVFDQMYREETEKWDVRYSELLNLHKATYTALKKSNLEMRQKLEELSGKLEVLEKNHANATQRVVELQHKSMEGQKKALNIEINHSRENTKQLLDAIEASFQEKFLDNNYNKKAPENDLAGASDSDITDRKIIPLYNDPNKELTRDEIAELFKNYGK